MYPANSLALKVLLLLDYTSTEPPWWDSSNWLSTTNSYLTRKPRALLWLVFGPGIPIQTRILRKYRESKIILESNCCLGFVVYLLAILVIMVRKSI